MSICDTGVGTMPRELERIEKTLTKGGQLRARCPSHRVISHACVGATEAGPMFLCHPGADSDLRDHYFVRPWAEGERLGG